jgi:hypothetical protein
MFSKVASTCVASAALLFQGISSAAATKGGVSDSLHLPALPVVVELAHMLFDYLGIDYND